VRNKRKSKCSFVNLTEAKADDPQWVVRFFYVFLRKAFYFLNLEEFLRCCRNIWRLSTEYWFGGHDLVHQAKVGDTLLDDCVIDLDLEQRTFLLQHARFTDS
jgi:hypothetical protein